MSEDDRHTRRGNYGRRLQDIDPRFAIHDSPQSEISGEFRRDDPIVKIAIYVATHVIAFMAGSVFGGILASIAAGLGVQE